MESKNQWLLILSLGLCSGTILIDRFIIAIPDWIAITLANISIIAVIAFIITNRKATERS